MPEQQDSDTGPGLLRRVLRAPLLHFLLLGLLIFALAQWRAATRVQNDYTIVIDPVLEQYLGNLYSVQFGYYPDAVTLEKMIDGHIRDEILFREAVKLGLAQDDEIIRRRMVQKIEYLLLDGNDLSSPDENTLLAWYESHAQLYVQPARASFRHIYFNTDGEQETAARQRAQTLLASISDVTPAADAGDRFPLQTYYSEQSLAAVRQLFGQSEFSDAVFTVDTGNWLGPYASGYGLHLLLVEARSEAQRQPFEQVLDKVRQDWQEANRDQLFDSQMQELLSRYTVERRL